MKNIQLLFIIFLLFPVIQLPAQNTSDVFRSKKVVTSQQNPVTIFSTDSIIYEDSMDSFSSQNFFKRKNFSLLDSISNDTVLGSIFKPYAKIRHQLIEHSFSKKKRNMPTVKEIKLRNREDHFWYFWIIVITLLYISSIRIINPNNFKIFIQSVFNLGLSERIWEEQQSFFRFVILQLFAIYILIASLFVTYLMTVKHIEIFPNFGQQFFAVVGIILTIYFIKFLLHTFLGYLLQMKNLAIGFVANTISVNNFIAIVILPILVLLLFKEEPVIRTILVQTIVATFFLSVIYRIIRIVLLSYSFFSFPKMYLFIYICALEILPWFVFIKYISWFQI